MAGTRVDQQKVRRTRTGLIAHDPARAQPGYTLFAPMFGKGGHRLDGEAQSRRLGFIRRIRELGFTLDQVRTLL